jgi:hypothetical protein
LSDLVFEEFALFINSGVSLFTFILGGNVKINLINALGNVSTPDIDFSC